MRDFKGHQVWQQAHRFALDLYQHRRCFPAEERFGLTVELRRAAVSAGSSIAEACGREGERELARYLSIAARSAGNAERKLLDSLLPEAGLVANC